MENVLVSTSSFGRHDRRPLELLADAGYAVRTNPFGRTLTREESRELLTAAVGLVAGTEILDRSVLEAAPDLRAISRCGVGMDGVDLEAARDRSIVVLRTTTAHVDAVAELALAGILDLLRHVARADRAVRSGAWDKPMGRLLRGKTIGIVGLGKTGKRLAQLCGPFEVVLRAVDPVEDADFAATHGVAYGSLETVLRESDIVTLHLEHSAETHHLIDGAGLSSMKAGALLVNVARGGLVDESALARALRDGRLAGAYLDVFETEPYSGPLAELDGVLLTPHIGSYAVESRIAMELEAAENLVRALEESAP